MQASVSDQQEQSLRLQQEMGRRLQEKEQTIRVQREQVRTHRQEARTGARPSFRISCIRAQCSS